MTPNQLVHLYQGGLFLALVVAVECLLAEPAPSHATNEIRRRRCRVGLAIAATIAALTQIYVALGLADTQQQESRYDD